MFFNEEFETGLELECDVMGEAVEVDEFNVALYAEEMTGNITDVYETMLECDEEFHNLQVKMMKLEHVAIVSENATLLQEGKGEFKARVKEMFQTAKEKMKAFFKKVRDWFLNLFQSDTQFLKKYKEKILKSTKKVEFGYTLNVKDITKFAKPITESDINKVIDASVSSDKAVIKDNAMKALTGGKVATSAALKETVKKAVEKKQEINANYAYKIVANFKEELNQIKDIEKASDSVFDVIIRGIKDDQRQDYINGDKKDKEKGKRISVCKVISAESQKLSGVLCEALKARKNAARNAVREIIGGEAKEAKKAKKEEANNESYLFGYEFEGNVLDRF